MNSSWTRSVFGQFKDIGVFQACACGACCYVSRGQRLQSAVLRAVARQCARRALSLSVPSCEQCLGHCVLRHPVRHTPDGSSFCLKKKGSLSTIFNLDPTLSELVMVSTSSLTCYQHLNVPNAPVPAPERGSVSGVGTLCFALLSYPLLFCFSAWWSSRTRDRFGSRFIRQFYGEGGRDVEAWPLHVGGGKNCEREDVLFGGILLQTDGL